MDIAYIFQSGVKDSIALRYSLRSLVNIAHDRVFLVGDKPDWVCNVIHVAVRDFNNPRFYRIRAVNTWNKIINICRTDISDDFILFNDDYFLLNKVDTIPYYYRGRVPVFRNPTGYQEMVMRSAKGFENPLHFGTHTPIVYQKSRFLDISALYKISQGLDHKIIYCNHYKVEPVERMMDCKIRSISKFKLKGTFVSTVNKIESDPVFEKEMNRVFPEKSKYE